ncbi:MAG: hypothetical protein V4722_02055 [Bacteroidota bacterium]
MDFFGKAFNNPKPKQPEDDYTVTITDTYIRVEHPQRKTEQVLWENIQQIKMINTSDGPWFPDVWLALYGKEDGCVIPQGAKGFDEVYDTVSKYHGFNFDNFIQSMSCTDNAEFDLWTKK